MGFRLGILEQSVIEQGESAELTLQKTVELAQLAEQWGYDRFWVSEHHHSVHLAGSNPEILATFLAAHTKTIRIGSGGVLLNHYSPYKVAEAFHVLASLVPGRIDVGVGKGPGGFPLSTQALRLDQKEQPMPFEEKFGALHQFLTQQDITTGPYAGLLATPLPQVKPELSLLGTSAESAKLAAQHDAHFVYGTMFNANETAMDEAIQAFHAHNKKGRLIVAVSVIVAPTKQQAEQQVMNRQIVKVHLANGQSVTVLDEASGHQFAAQSGQAYELEVQTRDIITGTAADVWTTLTNLAETYGIDEFLIQTPVQHHAAKQQSLQLLGAYKQQKTAMPTV